MRSMCLACLGVLMPALWGCRGVWPTASLEKPRWVDAAGAEGDAARFLSVTGVAGPDGDTEELAEQADYATREQLRGALNDYARQMLSGFLEAHPEYGSPLSSRWQQFAAMVTAEVSGGILRHSLKQDLWQGPDGKAYVLYRLPFAVVHDEIAARMRSTIRHINPFGPAADRAIRQMQAFLETRQREQLTAGAISRPEMPGAPADQLTPSWLEAGRHDAYPSDKFMTAIGVGADLESAEKAARTELTGRLDAELARIAQRVRSEEPHTAFARDLPWMEPWTAAFSEADLAGDRIAEHWHDPVTETHYALAVLDRETAAAVCRLEMTRALDLASSLKGSARNHEKAENFAACLRDYGDALAAASQAVRAQLKGIAMAPPPRAAELEDLDRSPLLAQIKEDLQSVLQSISIEKTGGDQQWLPPGVPPRAPFQVRVAGRGGKPVAGVPLSFVPDGQARPASGSALTDVNGIAEWRMQQPLPSGQSDTITASLDLHSLSAGADLFRVRIPSVSFRCVLRSRQNTCLAVFVRERTAPGRTVSSPLAEDIRQALSAEGFKLLPESDVLSHLKAADVSVHWPDGQVVESFSGLREAVGPDAFLLIVTGEAQVRLESTVKTERGKLYIVYCPYTIRVLDGDPSAAQKTVLMVSGKGRGGYLDDEPEAGRRARAEASAEAVAQLVGGLRERLGMAADQ